MEHKDTSKLIFHIAQRAVSKEYNYTRKLGSLPLIVTSKNKIIVFVCIVILITPYHIFSSDQKYFRKERLYNYT